jgi:hypothetical protein
MARRVFSPEFKVEAVRLVRERGVNVARAAQRLRRSSASDRPGKGKSTDCRAWRGCLPRALELAIPPSNLNNENWWS